MENGNDHEYTEKRGWRMRGSLNSNPKIHDIRPRQPNFYT